MISTTINTVGDLIQALQKFDLSMPIFTEMLGYKSEEPELFEIDERRIVVEKIMLRKCKDGSIEQADIFDKERFEMIYPNSFEDTDHRAWTDIIERGVVLK